MDFRYNFVLPDVDFVFGEDGGVVEHVPAYKSVLASKSEVFKAMFYGSLAEGTKVKIVDVSAEAFKVFIECFSKTYKQKPKLTLNNIAEVMYAGDKYDVKCCMETCQKFLMETLSNDEICFGFELALRYGLTDLKSLCQTRIKHCTSEVLQTVTFLSSDRVTVLTILDQPSFSCSEFEVFNACIAWAMKNCPEEIDNSIRSHIEPMLYRIRFVSISPDDLSHIIATYSSLFTAEELKELNHLCSSRKYFKPSIFCGPPRILFRGRIICHGPSKSDHHERHLSPFDCYLAISNNVSVTFSISKRLELVELQFDELYKEVLEGYASTNWIGVKLGLEIIEKVSGTVCFESGMMSVPSNRRLPLRWPILIEPNTDYEIRADISSSRSWQTLYRSHHSKTQILDDGTIITFDEIYSVIKSLHFKSVLRN